MPDSSAPAFVHLHVHSAFSLAEGAIKLPDLAARCREYAMPAVGVTDTGNMFGAMQFAKEASKSGIQPIFGCQIGLGERRDELVLLAQTEEGYRNLCRLISRAYMEGGTADPHVGWEDLQTHHDGLIALSGGLNGPISRALADGRTSDAAGLVQSFRSLFGDRFYIEIQRHGWSLEARIEPELVTLADQADVPLVATNDCYFLDHEMHKAHDALLCIAEGRYISEESRRRVTPEHGFKSQAEMADLFADLPDALENTVQIARRCSFLLEPSDPILPPFPTEAGRSEKDELWAQAQEGLQTRLEHYVFAPGTPEEDKAETLELYRQRLVYELNVIGQMGFPGYFLIVSDFIRWAKQQKIPVGPGRGSGAGSLVAWALEITDLDPMRFNLLFERFLNPERVSMPDFDVDFCQDRRDEVIHYVQCKYGVDRVAQIITFGKLQARAVVRDVGRVLQLPYGQVDRIAKMIPNNPASPMTLQEALDQDADLRTQIKREQATRDLIDIALKLEGLYRHASTHAAGVVIGDRPLQDLVPLYRDPRSEMPVTQFNMKDVETAGLVKFDFLGLKTLTVIRKALDLIRADTGEEIDILKIPLDDPKVFEMLSRGENTGVFQLESAGMRDLGRQMQASNFEQIIAIVALYRPGPMDNIPKYLACLHGQEERDYMHPLLEPVLKDTYGVMIYQEQVMQAAQILGGYSLGAADLLRRAMGKKIQSEMDAQREKFVQGARETNNVPDAQANAIFDQIAKFAGYGFNKAHSAGYALIAYQTAWLKAHYPVSFMAASMTLDMGNTDKLAVFKQECDRLGIAVLPPDINAAGPEFQVEGTSIRYALGALKGVGGDAMARIQAERLKNGAYQDLYDLVERAARHFNRRAFEVCAWAGAFDSLDPDRARVAASADLLLRHGHEVQNEKESGQSSLFGSAGPGENLVRPVLPEAESWDLLDRLNAEFEAIGFYLSAHPLDERERQLQSLNVTPAAEIEERMNGHSALRFQMAGVVLKKQERSAAKTGNKFAFVQLSDRSGVYEVAVFSELLIQTRELLEPGRALYLTVDVEKREEQLRMTAQAIQDLDSVGSAAGGICVIELASAEGLEKLTPILNELGKGRTEIRVSLPLQEIPHHAEFSILNMRSLDGASRRALQKCKSVVGLEERQ